MRTKKPAPRTRSRADWPEIRRQYEQTRKSVRALAKAGKVTEGAVRKRIKAENWGPRPAANEPAGTHPMPSASAPAQPPAILPPEAGEPDVDAIVHEGVHLARQMLSELKATTLNVGEIEGMIIAETATDTNLQRRNSMFQAISLPARSMVGKNLATMLKTLRETVTAAAAGGKKAGAQAAARSLGASGRFATPAAPRLIVNNDPKKK